MFGMHTNSFLNVTYFVPSYTINIDYITASKQMTLTYK